MKEQTLGERLLQARQALKLSQTALAARWQCNNNTISRIEQGNDPGMIGLYRDAINWLEHEAKIKTAK
jgi:transcriptional regulator with XRE-family HTH domain